MKFIHFTRKDGAAFVVNVDHISVYYEDLDPNNMGGTVIVTDSFLSVQVKESMMQVTELISDTENCMAKEKAHCGADCASTSCQKKGD